MKLTAILTACLLTAGCAGFGVGVGKIEQNDPEVKTYFIGLGVYRDTQSGG